MEISNLLEIIIEMIVLRNVGNEWSLPLNIGASRLESFLKQPWEISLMKTDGVEVLLLWSESLSVVLQPVNVGCWILCFGCWLTPAESIQLLEFLEIKNELYWDVPTPSLSVSPMD